MIFCVFCRRNRGWPAFCRILGWFLCLACIGGGAFLVVSYGLTFGNDRTYQWMTSMIVSFFASLIITQPIKVFTWKIFNLKNFQLKSLYVKLYSFATQFQLTRKENSENSFRKLVFSLKIHWFHWNVHRGCLKIIVTDKSPFYDHF